MARFYARRANAAMRRRGQRQRRLTIGCVSPTLARPRRARFERSKGRLLFVATVCGAPTALVAVLAPALATPDRKKTSRARLAAGPKSRNPLQPIQDRRPPIKQGDDDEAESRIKASSETGELKVLGDVGEGRVATKTNAAAWRASMRTAAPTGAQRLSRTPFQTRSDTAIAIRK